MSNRVPRSTRGHGMLEGMLARARCTKAMSLIEPVDAIDSVLDIGCGTFPLFLSRMNVRRRVGIERQVCPDARTSGIELVAHDIAASGVLPFPDNSFDAVTMLAVMEHVPGDVARRVVSDVRRVLRVGGVFVVTTPAAWTDGILRTMAFLRLVSPEEIDEHSEAYTMQGLRELAIAGGFGADELSVGTFEMGMNLWGRFVKKA